MEKIKVYNDSLTGKHLTTTVNVLREGGVAIIPTDTLYAIVCDALNPKAIERVCKIKGLNPDKSNLSILCDSISMVSDYSKFDNYVFKLMKDNCPGPFTFLLRTASSLPRAFKGRKVVGVRIPDNDVVNSIVSELGSPLLSTSIKFEEDDYGVNPDLISENYENIADLMILGEDGNLIPSAIVDCTTGKPELIREGPLPLS